MTEKAEAFEQEISRDLKGSGRRSLRFFKAFVKNPASVGAILPSAPELARAMIRDVHLGPEESLVELGPGTGAFTVQIREMMPDVSTYLGIEREAGFVELLEARFPDMCFIAASAEEAAELHQRMGLGPVKAIISSLPFATVPDSVRTGILDSVELLMAPGCMFRTFQYVHAYPLPSARRFRRDMEQRFGPCERSTAILPNLPPAYVLTWTA